MSDLVTGTPFWIDRDRTPRQDHPSLSSDLRADVAVIGGGVTGALIAYELTAAGADVVVLERGVSACESTSASSGLLLYETDSSLVELSRRLGESRAVRVFRLGLESIRRIEELSSSLGHSFDFARRSSLYLASTREAVAGLEREHELRRRHGFETTFVNESELRRRFHLDAPAALYSGQAGQLDSYRFTRELLAAASVAGARVFQHTEVTAVETQSAGGLAVRSRSGHQVHVRRAVWATGYTAAHYIQPPTARLASTWVIVSEPIGPIPGWEDDCLIWETARPYFYLRRTNDGRIVAGGGDEPGLERHQDRDLLRRKSEWLRERTEALLPQVRLQVAHAWGAGFIATEDGLPYVGSRPADPNVWVALAYGGNGITFSVAAAGILRDAWLGRSNADSSLFPLNRRSGM